MGLQNTWAKVLGFVLLIAGVLGFFQGEMLLNAFGVNALHNLVHVISGIVGIWAGFGAASFAQNYNKWFGVIYLAIAMLGFLNVLAFLNVNAADNWLHLVIGIVSAGIGFWAKD